LARVTGYMPSWYTISVLTGLHSGHFADAYDAYSMMQNCVRAK